MTDEDPELAKIKERMAEQLVAEAQAGQARANAPAAPVTITDPEFEEFVSRYETVVVDFWAPWCGPCRIIGPILDELAHEMQGSLVVGKLNVDENPAAPGRFGVQGIPTMIVFRNGKMVDRIVGAMPKQQLKAKLTAHTS